MLRNMLRRNRRQPLAALAVLLFSAVLTVSLCHLHRSGQAELQSFEDTYASVPVFIKVVDLDGSRPKDVSGVNGWVLDLLESDWMTPTLSPYVREIHMRVSIPGTYGMQDEQGKPILNGRKRTPLNGSQITVGISSTYMAEELTEGWGGKIYWNDGYGESVFSGNAFVCVVPQSMKHYEKVELTYRYDYWPTGVTGDLGGAISMEFRQTFLVAGYYTDPGNHRIYCPFQTVDLIHTELRKTKVIEEIGAILKDNTQLPQFREDAAHWFVAPNPMGKETPWGKFGYENYLYALDIDDAMLTGLETNMRNSIRLNRLAFTAIFVLAAGAGFATGFLVTHTRRREIVLMRTIGVPHRRIFGEFALEQVLCVALGIFLGGSYTLWEPAKQLAVFACIYIAGLTAALLIFIKSNLLATIKEDE